MLSFETLYWGLTQSTLTSLLVISLILTHITIASVTIFLHRHQAHRSIELAPSVSHFFRFWLWLTTGMITKEWVAVHRKHHAKVETAEDPHSPIHFGIHRILWAGVGPYRTSAKCLDVINRYGHGTPNDFIERHLYTPHFWLGIVLMLLIDLVMFGLLGGIMVWGIQMVWIPFFAAGVINGLGHYLGYRNFEPKDASTNILPWGILIGGEELHNNHHAYSDSAKLSIKWYEFDIGYLYIRILSLLKLATIKRTVAHLPQITETEHQVLTMLTKCKMNIIDHYSKQVIQHLVHTTVNESLLKKHALSPTRLARWMHREYKVLAKWKQIKLTKILEKDPVLKTIHVYRTNLSYIIHNNKMKKSELKEAVAEWCKQAKKTNIDQLEAYSNWLIDLLEIRSSQTSS